MMDSFWSVEAILEAACLGLDVFFLTLTYKNYRRTKDSYEAIKDAEILEPDAKMMQKEDWVKPYTVIKGVVKAIGNSLNSDMDPAKTGVIRRTILKEHKVTRKTQGFWSDEEGILNVSDAVVPFMLVGRGAHVEVLEPLAADQLDLIPTGDTYEPINSDLWGHVKSWVTGEHVKGVQKFEEMLLEGSSLTGVGEVTLSKEGLQLQPPKHLMYLLSSLPLSRLQVQLERQVRNRKLLLGSLSVLGAIMLLLLLRRYWKLRKQQNEKSEEAERLQRDALIRRRENRENNTPLSPSETCLVCLENPKEVVLLNCGHVSLCVDCYLGLPSKVCPVCRADIVAARPAFF